MITHKIALSYEGYLVEIPVAIDDEINALDLNEQTMHYASSSSTDPIYKVGMRNRYCIIEIELPNWADTRQYLDNSNYKTAVNTIMRHYHDPDDPRMQQLTHLNEFELHTIIKLLNTKNFKSPYRQSLRNQIEAWLSEETHKYEKPLSNKQIQSITRY